MKKIIFSVVLLLVATITKAQKNFYEAMEANGESAIYEGFADQSANGDGTYNFTRGKPAISLKVTRLVTGQPVGFVATPVDKGVSGFSQTELSNYVRVDSYPNVLYIKHKYTKDAYMMTDDILFVVSNTSDSDVPKLANVKAFYVLVKERGETVTKEGAGKKKKGGFMARMKAKVEGVGQSPTFKYIKRVNIEKVFNDYVTAMKAKQANPLTTKDKMEIAKIRRAREAGDEEIKRYNDSIKATPEYAKLKTHQARMEQMDNNNARNLITINNKTGRDIYIYQNGSRNGTRINANSSTKVTCNSNYTYKFDSNSGGTGTAFYSANANCGSSVSVR
ncbi:hypothetical protein Q4512_15985 [Oceanihabitans sp. 2_MG-2023]|uniref:hypothetical protein n=1 Tax=Oceanihabitans sp. 2_MG-2023 TaxID=3062661 RepID=UPI0026E19DF7|nr:hypothetical protein [Oceanihabitans sp. 2_MG-2023]MDO6598419.1 hypothetical protein [Oceanihabitans sp. 2_MG-2023]